ncbi:Fip1 motif-domain-containing protein [Clohesyomyces aquaticus]|uniref:Fip1 motif-domain-containing protein n=1 Tax=Clohesyomyces aquaticus TaxID=1231657 RepID=A0A1Y1YVH9_9PLEO|nr:Fip1 motif-domain-containing protein [Clohesyomyces aquaticus]
MDDGEDDDLYGPSEPATTSAEPKKEPAKDESDSDNGDEPMDEGLESGEEEESDSDLEIIIDRPETASKPPAHDKPPAESKAIKIEQPPQTSTTHSKPSSTTPSATLLPHQQGTAYPAVRTSTIDVNADPVYPPAGKTVSQIDMDADLAESSKPWRLPGADQSDYFNYGFDEFTWEMYRQRQASVTTALQAQKAETAQFQQMFMPGMPAPGAPAGPAAGAGAGGSGGPGVPGAPTGPAAQTGGPAAAMGMPPGMNEEQMAVMFAQMQGQGMDMSNIDFTVFMQMAGGGAMPGFPQQQGGGGGGGGQFGGGGGQGAQGGGGGGGGGGRGSGRRGGRW